MFCTNNDAVHVKHLQQLSDTAQQVGQVDRFEHPTFACACFCFLGPCLAALLNVLSKTAKQFSCQQSIWCEVDCYRVQFGALRIQQQKELLW